MFPFHKNIVRVHVEVNYIQEVAVSVLSVVGMIQTAQNRRNYLDREIERHDLIPFLEFFEYGAQILPENVFHSDEILIVEFSEIVDFNYVFVAYIADYPRLGKKHLHERRIAAVLFQHLFNRDRHRVDRRIYVFGKKNLRHSARRYF